MSDIEMTNIVDLASEDKGLTEAPDQPVPLDEPSYGGDEEEVEDTQQGSADTNAAISNPPERNI